MLTYTATNSFFNLISGCIVIITEGIQNLITSNRDFAEDSRAATAFERSNKDGQTTYWCWCRNWHISKV